MLIWFFFSSRRRHTRSLCDWSSDVCSSDLTAVLVHDCENPLATTDHFHVRMAQTLGDIIECQRLRCIVFNCERSEERRVGKEWSARWATGDQREKTAGLTWFIQVGMRWHRS